MSAEPFRISHIDGGFEIREGLPRPNWQVIFDWAKTVGDSVEPHALWTEIAAHWLSQLADTLKNDYAIWESQEFLVLCSRGKAESERLIRFPDSFSQFVKTASASDAGEAALWSTCRRSLSQSVSDCIGNQDWSPRPEKWPAQDVKE